MKKEVKENENRKWDANERVLTRKKLIIESMLRLKPVIITRVKQN
jgi:hypothetical protein